jgi:hypothetical protein
MGIAGLDEMDVDELPDDFGRWLIHGPQGSGKTKLASTIAELGPCLFIDLIGEKGVRSFKGAPYADNITVVRPRTITKLDDVFWALNKGDARNKSGEPYVSVVIDSLTALQKMAGRVLMGHDETAVREIRQGVAPATLQTWGQSLDIMTDTSTFWFGLADGDRPHPMHVVFTAQTLIAEEIQPGGAKEVRRMPDVQKGARSITLAAPDYIVYTDFEDNPDALGDDLAASVNHIVRFGANPAYRTKGRIPVDLHGRVPTILGRGKNPPSLATLSRVLRIGGAPALPTKEPAVTKASVKA